MVGAKFFTIDIKNFYLNTHLEIYEYVRLKLPDVPDDMIEEYQLANNVTKDGFVYVEIRKGVYGLPQAGLSAQELLEKGLADKEYYQSTHIPGIWIPILAGVR